MSTHGFPNSYLDRLDGPPGPAWCHWALVEALVTRRCRLADSRKRAARYYAENKAKIAERRKARRAALTVQPVAPARQETKDAAPQEA